MASQSLQELASLLPGGTYISFTVLAQLTTNTTDMAARLASPICQCVDGRPADSSCTVRHVCGTGYWDMSVALLVISAVVVCMLAWYGEDLVSKKETLAKVKKAEAQQPDGKTPPASLELTTSAVGLSLSQSEQKAITKTAMAEAAEATAFARRASNTDTAPWRDAKGLRPTSSAAFPASRSLNTTGGRDVADLPPTQSVVGPNLRISSSSKLQKQLAKHEEFKRKVEAMSVTERRRKLYELYVAQFVRTSGAVVIFLVLAVFTPPVSTCVLPPCVVPPTVCHVVPLLVSFAVSAFIAVQRKVISRLVKVVDWLVSRALDAFPWLHGSHRTQGEEAGKSKSAVAQGGAWPGGMGSKDSELPA